MLTFLAERGYPDAKAVHSAEESLIFALPKRAAARPQGRRAGLRRHAMARYLDVHPDNPQPRACSSRSSTHSATTS